jgi:hypothetical protein
VQAADVGVAGAVGEGEETGAGGVEAGKFVGCALGEVDDVQVILSMEPVSVSRVAATTGSPAFWEKHGQ